MEKELISIVCPTLNEEKHIRKTIESFLDQKTDTVEIEILIIDGMSEDATRSIVNEFERAHQNIHLIDNPQRKTPFAFNAGIANAKGNYVAILGAHARYDQDYIQTCYNELKKTGSVGCAGRVRLSVGNSTTESKLMKMLQESAFGVSSGSFKKVKEGYTTMINFPVYKKEVLKEIGGYDTSLHRNQDNDLNQRVWAKGNKLYHTWKTGVDYVPPDTFKKVTSYAYKNGFWNAKSLLRKPKSMKLHHLVPFLFVSGIVASFAFGLLGLLLNWSFAAYLFIPGVVALLLHLMVGSLVSFNIFAREKEPAVLLLPFLFFAFHFCYGWGSVTGFIKRVN